MMRRLLLLGPVLLLLALLTGPVAAAPAGTERITDGTLSGAFPAETTDITPDGRFVAFTYPSGLGHGISVYDRQLQTMEPVIVPQALGNGGPSISADGRYVVYALQNGFDGAVFIRDRLLDVTTQVPDAEGWPALSNDGTRIAFGKEVPDPDDPGIIIHSLFVTHLPTATTQGINVDSSGAPGNASAYAPMFSGDGTTVVFSSHASNLVPNDVNTCPNETRPGECSDIFIHHLPSGLTEKVTISTAGVQTNAPTFDVAGISDDGRFVTFSSPATNLVPNDTNGQSDAFLRDRLLGTTVRTSVRYNGQQISTRSIAGGVSGDGRFVGFYSEGAPNQYILPPWVTYALGTQFLPVVVVRDMVTGALDRVDLSSINEPGNNSSDAPELSADGSVAAFWSLASNLVPGDSGFADLFVRDRGTDADNDGIFELTDVCPVDYDPTQLNTEPNYIDQSPPYSPSQDDRTWVYSDFSSDACDADDDNDGRSDTDEASGAGCAGATTNSILRDTDGDRFLDGAECDLGADPTSAASTPPFTACGAPGDADGDKVTDRVEVCRYNSNPASLDTDGDATLLGGKDGCEIASLNGDRIVSSIDQGMLAYGMHDFAGYTLNVDINKDGVLSSIDQGLQASFIVPGGRCP